MANTDYITLTEARTMTLGALRASSQSFTLVNDSDVIDRAIQMACDEVVRRVPDITLTDGTVATTATSTSIDVTALDGAWRPSRTVRFEFSQHRVRHVDYDTVAKLINTGTTGTARPELIGFRTPTKGFFDYCPGTANQVLTVTWRPPFTAISPGVTAGTTELNIPAQYMRPILIYGAATFLEYYDVESKIPPGALQRFENLIMTLRGDVGMNIGEHDCDPDNYV
jgi:hypothetical protein